MRKFHPLAVEAMRQGKRIYHLNIGQPDISTPQAFFDAIRESQPRVLEYAASAGVPELLAAVQGYYGRLGVALQEDDILVTNGGSEALMMLMLSILDEGDEIIVPEPFYPNYTTFIHAAGGVVCPVPTKPEEGYRYADREKFESRINERTRAILLTTPGNPTGVALTREEMAMFKDLAKEHNLYLICDEVYREFAYETDELLTMLSFADAADNVVIVDSVSKRFSACGARVGATLDQIGAAALYGVDPSYFAATKAEYKRRRDTVVRKLREIPGVICEEPKGAFYLMAALPVDDADQFQTFLLEEFADNQETVMFAPGESFYATPGKGKNEIRIAYILKQEDLERAMDLLALGIEAYNKR